MEQRQSADPATVTTTQFASDAIELLARTVRQAFPRTGPAIGTEHLLSTLLDDSEKPGEALVPGFRESGALGGEIRARGTQHWARDDSGPEASAEAPAGESGTPDDVIETDATWREAVWTASSGSKPLREKGAERPRPTGALRAVLHRALRLARAEGAADAHERHLARALLEIPDSRALEALALRRVDVKAAADALDAQAAAVRAGAEPWEKEAAGVGGAVKVLRDAGVLGERGVWWTRRMLSWMTRTSGDGAPVLLVLGNEAERQAVRNGRAATEPVDLLLAVVSLDRGLTVAGLSLPDELRAANSAADALYSAGIRQVDLVRTVAASSPDPAADATVLTDLERTPETDRAVAATRLLAAERKDDAVGTVHLLLTLLTLPESPVTRLLEESGTNVPALRTRLEATLEPTTPAA